MLCATYNEHNQFCCLLLIQRHLLPPNPPPTSFYWLRQKLFMLWCANIDPEQHTRFLIFSLSPGHRATNSLHITATWSMQLTETQGNSCNVQYLWSDSSKYVNLHHPVSFNYWNPEVCWLTSPMGAIKIIHFSMLTCKSMSTYISQYLLVIEILKYVDLHHPWLHWKWSNCVCWLAKVCQLISPIIF